MAGFCYFLFAWLVTESPVAAIILTVVAMAILGK